jgi:hypothetical protein
MARGDPLKIVAVNIDATALLLDLARIHRLKRLPRNMAWRVLVSGLDASMVTCAILPQRPGQRQKRLS